MRHKLVEWGISNATSLTLVGLALYLVTRHLLLRHFKKLAEVESTWSPFQSAEVRDICEHLTPEERGQLINDAAWSGRQIAWRLAIPFGIVGASFYFSIRAGFALLGLFVIDALVFQRRWIREHRQRGRRMLCETEYGKVKGYRPETLRLFSFPWSRCKP
jgi:hypothetical protein